LIVLYWALLLGTVGCVVSATVVPLVPPADSAAAANKIPLRMTTPMDLLATVVGRRLMVLMLLVVQVVVVLMMVFRLIFAVAVAKIV
jgi:hypothetical protein